MKIIDKNGKIFGKISILDIIIVACIVFVGVIFVMNKADKVSVPIGADSSIEYTVKFKAYNVYKGERSPFNVDDKLYSNNGEYIGKITEVTEKATISKIKLQNGEYTDFESPICVDYFITVEGKGTSTEKGTFAEGTFALYPNNSVLVNSKLFAGNAVVLSVEKNN